VRVRVFYKVMSLATMFFSVLQLHVLYRHVVTIFAFFSLQSRTPALVFEYVNNTDFKVSVNFYVWLIYRIVIFRPVAFQASVILFCVWFKFSILI